MKFLNVLILGIAALLMNGCQAEKEYHFKEELREALTSDLYSGSGRCTNLKKLLEKIAANNNQPTNKLEQEALFKKQDIEKYCFREVNQVPRRKVPVFLPINEHAKTLVKLTDSQFPFLDKQSVRTLLLEKNINIKVDWLPAPPVKK